jgi:hypothetical protein
VHYIKNDYFYIIISYGALLLISFITHYIALKELDPYSLITANDRRALWGLGTPEVITLEYFFLPLFFSIAILLVNKTRSGYLWLIVIPFLFLPLRLPPLISGW